MNTKKGLQISHRLFLQEWEIRIYSIKAQGPGGQHVNKVSTGVHLRFDINSSSLPEECKVRLLGLNDKRISKDGEIIIKAAKFRSQQNNREDALIRLKKIIQKSLRIPKKRKETRPGKKAKLNRLWDKKHRSKLKATRAAP